MNTAHFDINPAQLLDYQVVEPPSFQSVLNMKLDLVSSIGAEDARLEFLDVYSFEINGLPRHAEECEPILDCFFDLLSGQKLLEYLQEREWSYTDSKSQKLLLREPLGKIRIITAFYNLVILSAGMKFSATK